METKAPEHTRPFNLEHAKAGAPFCGDKGQAIKVLVWDRKHPSYPIVGMELDGEQELVAFRANGNTDHNYGWMTTNLVMTPLGFIDGKPVFAGDDYLLASVIGPADTPAKAHPTDRVFEGCRWPAPAKVYPASTFGADDLKVICREHGVVIDVSVHCGGRPMPRFAVSLDPLQLIANAALRHAIDAEQVVPMAEVLEMARALRKREFDQLQADKDAISRDCRIAERTLEQAGYRNCGGELWKPPLGLSPDQRAARDLAIAEAVRDECYKMARAFCIDVRMKINFYEVDLTTIIDKVAP